MLDMPGKPVAATGKAGAATTAIARAILTADTDGARGFHTTRTGWTAATQPSMMIAELGRLSGVAVSMSGKVGSKSVIAAPLPLHD